MRSLGIPAYLGTARWWRTLIFRASSTPSHTARPRLRLASKPAWPDTIHPYAERAPSPTFSNRSSKAKKESLARFCRRTSAGGIWEAERVRARAFAGLDKMGSALALEPNYSSLLWAILDYVTRCPSMTTHEYS